jgi:hypothetical protein
MKETISQDIVSKFVSHVRGGSVNSWVNSANANAKNLSKELGLPIEFVPNTGGDASADYTPGEKRGEGSIRVYVNDDMIRASNDNITKQLTTSLNHEARHNTQYAKTGKKSDGSSYQKSGGKIDSKKYYKDEDELDAVAPEITDDLKDEVGLGKLKNISGGELKKHADKSPRLAAVLDNGGSADKLAKSVKDVAKHTKEQKMKIHEGAGSGVTITLEDIEVSGDPSTGKLTVKVGNLSLENYDNVIDANRDYDLFDFVIGELQFEPFDVTDAKFGINDYPNVSSDTIIRFGGGQTHSINLPKELDVELFVEEYVKDASWQETVTLKFTEPVLNDMWLDLWSEELDESIDGMIATLIAELHMDDVMAQELVLLADNAMNLKDLEVQISCSPYGALKNLSKADIESAFNLVNRGLREDKVVTVKHDNDDHIRVQKVGKTGEDDPYVRFPKKLRKRVGQKFDVENLTMGKNGCYTASGEIMKESDNYNQRASTLQMAMADVCEEYKEITEDDYEFLFEQAENLINGVSGVGDVIAEVAGHFVPEFIDTYNTDFDELSNKLADVLENF